MLPLALTSVSGAACIVPASNLLPRNVFVDRTLQPRHRGHVLKLHELAETADPFIKKRLLQLAEKYERQLRGSHRPPADLPWLGTKMTPER
jgi:hypothetical protein